jgi:hypothetical protein
MPTTETKLGIGFRLGKKGDKLGRKKGNRNQNSKHKMRTHYGMMKKKEGTK